MCKKLAGDFIKVAVGASLLLGLAACESAEDLAMKPDLIDLMKQDAMTYCDPQYSPRDEQGYADRLDGVLRETDSQTLRYFRDNNIVVCLDKRIAEQDSGWDMTPYGMFYPGGAKSILSIWDNGKHIQDSSWYESTAESKGPYSLDQFPDSFGGYFDTYAKLSDVKERMISHCSGKGCHIRWTPESEWGWNNRFDYPDLAKPPIIGQRASVLQLEL